MRITDIRPRRATALALTLIATLATLGAARGVRSAPGEPTTECPPDSTTAIAPPATPFPPESATAGVTHFTFIAYGDTRSRRDGTEIQPQHSRVMESMLATIAGQAGGPDAVRFVVSSGDATLSGRTAARWNVSYVPIIDRLTAGANVPFFSVVGNHDVSASEDLTASARVEGLCHYFAANAHLIPAENTPRRMNGYPTYAFGYGNTFFIAFDSNIAGDSTQMAWIERQLAGLDRRRYVNVIALFHHPAFSSGPDDGARQEQQVLEVRARYMPLFEKYHVRLLLNGHEHLFEHWVEHYQDATGTHRLDEIVSGGGGAPIYTFRAEPDLAGYLQANADRHVTVDHLVRPAADTTGNPHHYLVVRVNGDEISVQVIGVDWGASFAPYGSQAPFVLKDRPPQ